MPQFEEELSSPLPDLPVKHEVMDETTVMFPDITTEFGDTTLQDITNQTSPMGTETTAASISDEVFLQRFPDVNFPTTEVGPSTPQPAKKKREKCPQTIAGYLIPQEESPVSQPLQEPSTQDSEIFKRPRDPDDEEGSSRNKRMRTDENDNEPAADDLAQNALQPIFDHVAQIGEAGGSHSQLDGSEASEMETTYQDGEMDVNQEDMPFPNLDIDFDVEAMLNQLNQGVRTAGMGEKQWQQYVIEKRQVLQCIKQLHNCLKNAPTDKMEADPTGLKVPLMPHQRQAMSWMKWREEQKPCSGGILADEMGLGKTLQMIALILAAKNEKRARMLAEDPNYVDEYEFDDAKDWGSLDRREHYEGRTLVICPSSLMEQWEREISSKCQSCVLSSFIFHGVENKRMYEGQLVKFDIVITTYTTVTMEYKNYMEPREDKDSRLFNITWDRIVLDEAHIIRNHLGKICEAVCDLKGKTKWAITGTPIQNRERDFFPLLKYLNCEPFVELTVWNRWVDKGKLGNKRLIVITKTLMLRRTKQELVEKGYIKALPDKHFQTIDVELDKEELIVYQKLLLYSQSFFMEFLKKKEEKEQDKLYPRSFYSSHSLIAQHVPKKLSRMMRILLRHHSHKMASDYLLVLIMRLRQLCCHPALIKGMLDKEDTDLDDVEGERDIQRMDNSILEYISKMISEDEEDETDEDCEGFEIDDNMARNLMTSVNPLFNDERKSSKVREILKTIQNILSIGEKVVVVSQWTSFLQVIGNNLARMPDAKFAVFSGSTKLTDRQMLVDRINDYDDNLNVLLLSLTAGAVGLNLVGANHLLLIDNHWNPQLEMQAMDRLHRFGQFNDVHIYRFICKNTIEEKITALQGKKLKAASKVLDGQIAENLTIQDLATLFT